MELERKSWEKLFAYFHLTKESSSHYYFFSINILLPFPLQNNIYSPIGSYNIFLLSGSQGPNHAITHFFSIFTQSRAYFSRFTYHFFHFDEITHFRFHSFTQTRKSFSRHRAHKKDFTHHTSTPCTSYDTCNNFNVNFTHSRNFFS